MLMPKWYQMLSSLLSGAPIALPLRHIQIYLNMGQLFHSDLSTQQTTELKMCSTFVDGVEDCFDTNKHEELHFLTACLNDTLRLYPRPFEWYMTDTPRPGRTHDRQKNIDPASPSKSLALARSVQSRRFDSIWVGIPDFCGPGTVMLCRGSRQMWLLESSCERPHRPLEIWIVYPSVKIIRSQLIGYGMAGVMRIFLVYSQVVLTVQLFEMLHHGEPV
ncbi:hypothetical protein B0H14DRAFT_2640163 [Mycena olivaceomarginata]|nr:hypothetical protein B0H14DRAFT_2640163 [Mycena olivaceomarginata]